MNRANWLTVSPEGAKAISVLHHYVVHDTNLPSTLIILFFCVYRRSTGAHTVSTFTPVT